MSDSLDPRPCRNGNHRGSGLSLRLAAKVFSLRIRATFNKACDPQHRQVVWAAVIASQSMHKLACRRGTRSMLELFTCPPRIRRNAIVSADNNLIRVHAFSVNIFRNPGIPNPTGEGLNRKSIFARCRCAFAPLRLSCGTSELSVNVRTISVDNRDFFMPFKEQLSSHAAELAVLKQLHISAAGVVSENAGYCPEIMSGFWTPDISERVRPCRRRKFSLEHARTHLLSGNDLWRYRKDLITAVLLRTIELLAVIELSVELR
jgi:hypothetical protein